MRLEFSFRRISRFAFCALCSCTSRLFKGQRALHLQRDTRSRRCRPAPRELFFVPWPRPSSAFPPAPLRPPWTAISRRRRPRFWLAWARNGLQGSRERKGAPASSPRRARRVLKNEPTASSSETSPWLSASSWNATERAGPRFFKRSGKRIVDAQRAPSPKARTAALPAPPESEEKLRSWTATRRWRGARRRARLRAAQGRPDASW